MTNHLNTDTIFDPISESLPYDSSEQPGTQPAFLAAIRLVVPCYDRGGNAVDSVAAAQDYIAETLRDLFLDWGYMRATDPETGETIDGDISLQQPTPIVVMRPYVEGTFPHGEDR